MQIKIKDLIKELEQLSQKDRQDIKFCINNPELAIRNCQINSKLVEEGDIFVCIRGEKNDGHNYILEVITKEPSLIITSNQYDCSQFKQDYQGQLINIIQTDNPSRLMAIILRIIYRDHTGAQRYIGITGTNGKTSIAYYITQLLSYLDPVGNIGMQGTLGASVYNRGNLVHNYGEGSGRTTPYANDLHNSFKTMSQDYNVNNIVMEVSSHALVQDRVYGIPFSLAVFSNLTQDHLDYHHSMESYFSAKSILFEGLSSDSQAIINLDDHYAPRLIKILDNNNIQYITYSLDNSQSENCLYASDIQYNSDFEQELILHWQGASYSACISLIGKFNVYNILASIASMLALGYNIKDIITYLPNIQASKGRFERIGNCIIDYAHTPDGLEQILKTAQDIIKESNNSYTDILCIMGCGGDRDPSKRPLMGNIAKQYANKVIITSDNPRTESPLQIIADILAGINNIQNIIVEEDREKAIALGIKISSSNTLIIIAGKGHENYQIIGNNIIPFDDYAMAQKYLEVKEAKPL